MKTYFGTKKCRAKPMTRLEYNNLRQWEMPADEDGTDEGYLVEYLNGGAANHPDFENYISWCPKDVFEAAYQSTDAMAFGHAVEAMKTGERVARVGWNGKGMFLYYVPAADYPAERNIIGTMKGRFAGDMVPYGAYIAMFTAQGNVVPWLASQTDMLANDWRVVSSGDSAA